MKWIPDTSFEGGLARWIAHGVSKIPEQRTGDLAYLMGVTPEPTHLEGFLDCLWVWWEDEVPGKKDPHSSPPRHHPQERSWAKTAHGDSHVWLPSKVCSLQHTLPSRHSNYGSPA